MRLQNNRHKLSIPIKSAKQNFLYDPNFSAPSAMSTRATVITFALSAKLHLLLCAIHKRTFSFIRLSIFVVAGADGVQRANIMSDIEGEDEVRVSHIHTHTHVDTRNYTRVLHS